MARQFSRVERDPRRQQSLASQRPRTPPEFIRTSRAAGAGGRQRHRHFYNQTGSFALDL